MGSSNSGGKSKKCQECRIRKIKCDLKYPQCSQCLTIGKACSGSVSGNIFIAMNGSGTARDTGIEQPREGPENMSYTVANLPEPGLSPGGRFHNPFLTYPDASEGVDRLLSFYLSVIGRKIISVNPKAIWFPSALADPVLFQSTLYSSALHFNSLCRPDDSQLVVFHRTKLLSMVNERLRDSMQRLSDESIAAVALIVYSEVVSGPMTDYSTHMNGLKQMMTLRGEFGKSVLQGSLQRMLASSTVFAAVRLNCIEPAPLPSRDAFDISTPCKLAATDTPMHQLQAPSSADMVEKLKRYGFHPHVLRVLNDLSHLVSDCNAHPRMPMEDAHQADLDARLLYIEYRFVKYQNVDISADNQVQRSFCVACLVFVSIFMREMPGPAALNLALTMRLRETMDAIDETAWDEAPPDVMLWMTFIGTIIAIERPERPWFVLQAARMQHCFDFQNPGTVRASLKNVLWIHKIAESLCEDLCAEINKIHICGPL